MLPPLLLRFLDRLNRPCRSPRRWCGLQSQARHKRCQHEAKNKSPHIFFSDSKLGLAAQLTESAKPLCEICVGHEWSFGKNRAGNLALLRKLGGQHHFNVVGIPPVKVNGAVVSSTAIRARIERGDFAGAAVMLGRDYTILGTVREGSKLGRQLGFPTANLSAHSEQFPPNGVYFVEAWLEGVLHHGVVNVGFRPTVSGEIAERVIEVHLLDFHRDIYGADIEIKFVQFLRPEKKFESVEALGEQIAADVKKARELCAA